MRDLLQFMYHGEVSVKREDLTSFIGTAEVLQIKGLTNKEVFSQLSLLNFVLTYVIFVDAILSTKLYSYCSISRLIK